MRVSRVPKILGPILVLILGFGGTEAVAATPSFTISATNATMPTSGNGTITWTLTSINGFAGTVGVSCGPTDPPTHSILPQCNYTGIPVASPPYTLAANGTVTESFNLVANIPRCTGPCPVNFQRRPRHRGMTLALAGALLGLGFRRRAPRWSMLALLTVSALAGLAGISGCGTNPTLTPGSFAYTLTAFQTGTSTVMTADTTVSVTVPAGVASNLSSSNP